jgi:4-diphosphocytidyl-2-C-methyl-D-erythritol kinase
MVSFPNAKINLGLAITEKRNDGFHNLESCFYPVNWCDALEIIEAPKLTFTSSGIEIPGDSSSNLCMKVYETVKKDFDLPPVHIHLHKNIPIGAGLGGGSADASFTLKSLNSIFHLSLTETQMEDYVRPLGSDCAFFVRNQPVFAYGKGDQFKDINLSLAGHTILIIYPGIHISTKEAYNGVQPRSPEHALEQTLMQNISSWNNRLLNDFETSIFPNHPELEQIKTNLYENGALYASMSGSGSAIFGIFPSQKLPEFDFPKQYKTWQGVLN